MFANSALLAFREIGRNVLRSFLTILGIVIGVASVVILVTMGNGATAQVTKQIASLGSNLLMIRTGQHMGPGQSSSAPPFDLADTRALKNEIVSLAAVSPSSSEMMVAVHGNSNWNTRITGIDNGFFTVRNWSLSSGRCFQEDEVHAGAAVCVIGATVREELFGSRAPLDSKIRIGNFSCRVIGVLGAKGETSFGSDQDDLILLPLHTFQRRIAGNTDISTIQVSVKDGESTDNAKNEIELLLRNRRHISATEEDNFQVMDMKEISSMLTSTTRTLTTLLGAVAAVSLLVGGVGIMNIMLVSVTERTREIGIRLAIGAMERDVLLQFLTEAVVLSSFGGIIGIVLALLGSIILSDMLQIPFLFDPKINGIAFLFAAGVGVVFGYFPARKAAMLDPIDALRYE